jgi:hypothetical protein
LEFSGSLWLAVLAIGKWEMVKPPEDRAPIWVFDSMRLYAKNCREKSQEFGKLLSEHPSRQKWEIIDCLILEIWNGTGKYHDREIAILLTNASEVTGHKHKFTEDQIKKHRQKYVMPRIDAYRRQHPAKSAPIS